MPKFIIHYDPEWTEEVEADAWFPHGDIVELFNIDKFGIPNKTGQVNRTVKIVNTREIMFIDVVHDELEKVTQIQ